jgi:hypothetical protein
VEKKSDGIQDLHLDREKKKRELVCFEWTNDLWVDERKEKLWHIYFKTI